MTFGEKIKFYRNKEKLTQSQLAELLCVTAQAVSRWENDVVEPNISTIKKLKLIFKVSYSDLLD